MQIGDANSGDAHKEQASAQCIVQSPGATGDRGALGPRGPREGNLNVLLENLRISQQIVSLLGGVDASFCYLGISSIVTMFRVAWGIRWWTSQGSKAQVRGATSCSLPSPGLSWVSGRPEPFDHEGQAASESLSNIPFAELTDDSSKTSEDHHKPDDPAQPSLCSQLVWFTLLKEGRLRAYAEGQGVCSLLNCSEGLNTLGWGLGVSSQFNMDSQLVSGSDSQVSPPLQSPQRSKKVPKTAPKAPVVPQSTGITCPHFAKGFCRYGNICKFLHQDGSESSVPVKDTVSPEPTEVVCKHFAAGWCCRGDQCKFAHNSASSNSWETPAGSGEGRRVRHQPLAEDKKEQLRQAGLLDVCFRWAQGYCDNASCRFSHRHINAWESRLFKELLDCNEASPKALPREDVSAP